VATIANKPRLTIASLITESFWVTTTSPGLLPFGEVVTDLFPLLGITSTSPSYTPTTVAFFLGSWFIKKWVPFVLMVALGVLNSIDS